MGTFVQQSIAFCNRPERASDVISGKFVRHKEVDNDAISGVAIDYFGMDVCVKLGDSGSSRSRDIRAADFVSNERPNEHDRTLSTILPVLEWWDRRAV